VNFAQTEFSEVRLKGVLRSSGLPFGWFVSGLPCLELTSTKGGYGLSVQGRDPKSQGVLLRWSRFLLCFEDSVSLPGSSVRFASSWLRRTIAEAFTDPDRPATSRI
jgi:hypothetical protein